MPHAQSKSGSSSATPGLMMPPPKMHGVKKQRSKRTTSERHDVGFRSVPTTPNQNRAYSMGGGGGGGSGAAGGGAAQSAAAGGRPMANESDSDSACGFDTNWKE